MILDLFKIAEAQSALIKKAFLGKALLNAGKVIVKHPLKAAGVGLGAGFTALDVGTAAASGASRASAGQAAAQAASRGLQNISTTM